jgi:DNA-binding LacI/PurR family transcriptional regulator
LRTLRTKKFVVTVPLVRSMPPGRAPIVNGCEFSPRLGIPSVHIDDATAASDAMDHLYRRGHRCIGIVDDIRFARYTDPPLTTVAQPMRQIGEGTVRMLLEIVHGHGSPESVTLPHTLVVRLSTAAPRRL